MKYLVANWKATKNLNEAVSWINEFNTLLFSDKKVIEKLKQKSVKIIICPSFHLIYPVKELVKKDLNISLGAQDSSFFEKGNYTGEESAQNLVGLVDYCIVGHSERRKYLKETNNIIDQKIELLSYYDIEPILCVRDENDIIFDNAKIVTYEPINAIATGNNVSLENILEMKKKLHIHPSHLFFYGGSVDSENINSYISSSEINGYLVGTASKNPNDFFKIVQQSC